MTAAIQPIEGRSVHRIQSGQVIVDLCSVVKELVENSLDAGATAIEVRFKGSGLDAIEVQDNGSGISKENYASVALKHCTSKLRTFDDLATLDTFGFRGEALSSLCALSNVHIITATSEEAPKGSRLDFEPSGKLKTTTLVAAQRGTTVSVESIFKNLPVRQQDLRKNVKREYTKVINLLQAYACISINTKFVVSNTLGKKKTQVFATRANPSTKENITNVFGSKAAGALTALDCEFEMQSHGRTQGDDSRDVKIQGHVSRPVVGEGRQTPDRQMFFVNSRPCKLPQIAKAINDVYKGYNLSQSPFIFANVILDTGAYDVNVSPDKREILLHDQDALIESIKASVTELFDGHQQTVPHTLNPNAKLSTSRLLVGAAATSQVDASSATQAVPSSPGHDTAENSSSPQSPAREGLVSTPIRQPSTLESTLLSPRDMVDQFLAQRDQRKPATSLPETTSVGGSEKLQPQRQSLGLEASLPSRNDSPQLPERYFTSGDVDPAGDEHEESQTVRAVTFSHRLRIPNESTLEEDEPSDSEEPIRSVHSSPFKSSPGVVPNAFERMRPYRSPKKSNAQPTNWETEQTKSTLGRTFKKQKTSHSGFSGSLRAFVAPGTQLSPRRSSSGSNASGKELFQPDWPRRGPNRPSNRTESSPTRSSAGESAISMEGEESEDEELVEVTKGISTHRDSIASESHHSEDPDAESEEQSDGEWLDEEAKKAKEDAKVQKLIRDAEEQGARPSKDNVARASRLLRGGHKDATTKLTLGLDTSVSSISRQYLARKLHREEITIIHARQGSSAIAASSAEERLSLTVSKADFCRMRVVGQFNLGFILATRSPTEGDEGVAANDELFIIDQHASDEKYNFERLTATTVLQNQRLVQPQSLELTAVQRELVSQHQPALVRNGFVVSLHQPLVDDTKEVNDDKSDEEGEDDIHAGPSPRATLLSLPASREVTFSVADLEELLALLPDDADARPAKVRRLLAMRACRSSIMIGRALTATQMRGVVRNLGGLDKPWNCPHGRPTMRHLVGLGDWEGWKEGDRIQGGVSTKGNVNWNGWLAGSRQNTGTDTLQSSEQDTAMAT